MLVAPNTSIYRYVVMKVTPSSVSIWRCISILYYYIGGYILLYFDCINNNGEHERNIKYVGVVEWYDNIVVGVCK
jgi:hypothetical protein